MAVRWLIMRSSKPALSKGESAIATDMAFHILFCLGVMYPSEEAVSIIFLRTLSDTLRDRSWLSTLDTVAGEIPQILAISFIDDAMASCNNDRCRLVNAYSKI